MTDGLQILEAFIRELAVVVGALSASETSVGDAELPGGRIWTAAVTFSGPASGTCTVTLDDPGVVAVTRALLGGEDAPDDAIAGTVQELLTQAASALQNGGDIRGLTVDVGSAALYESLQLSGNVLSRAITSPSVDVPLIVSIEGELLMMAEPEPEIDAEIEVPAAAGTRHIEPGVTERIDVILDIELPVVVRFGRTDLPLRALGKLSPGSIIELGRSPDDPVELLVSDRVIARGEVVIVGGNYGVRIVEVVSPTERMRSMEVSA